MTPVLGGAGVAVPTADATGDAAAAPVARVSHAKPVRDRLRRTWRVTRFVLAWALLLMLVGAVAAAAIIPRLTGAVPVTVLSGSMQPSLAPGDLVVVKPVSGIQDIAVGDVITFQPRSGDPMLLTHRVISRDMAGPTVIGLTTQGDANGAPDDPIVASQVMGVATYSVPYLGWVAQAVGSHRVWLLVGLAAVLLGYATITLTGCAVGAMRERHEARGPSRHLHAADAAPAATSPPSGASGNPTGGAFAGNTELSHARTEAPGQGEDS